MPYFAMKSMARSEPLWIGCQHSTCSRSGAGTSVISLSRIAAIGHLRRDRVVLREGFPLEGLEQNLDTLLKHLPVGILVHERRAETFDFTGVVAAADAEDDPPAGQDVGYRIILGQPQRMPPSRVVPEVFGVSWKSGPAMGRVPVVCSGGKEAASGTLIDRLASGQLPAMPMRENRHYSVQPIASPMGTHRQYR